MTWRDQAPEPARLWIRWSPRRWPAPGAICIDLAERRLLWPAPTTDPFDLPPAPPRPDLVYLPPVPAAFAAGRAALAAALAATGAPVLAQEPAGAGALPPALAVAAIDLTAALLAPGAMGLEAVRAAAGARRAASETWAVLPLLPGLTPRGAALEPWLDALEALAPDALLLPAPALEPADRRRLAEAAGEERYEAIFHAAPPAEREVARAAARRGLPLFARRPPVAGAPPRAARNRELAAALAEAGDLWLRLGRGEPEGEALLAAARHLDATNLDVSGLAREGNLGVLDWLPPAARRLIGEALAAAPAATLRELRAAWPGAGEKGAG